MLIYILAFCEVNINSWQIVYITPRQPVRQKKIAVKQLLLFPVTKSFNLSKAKSFNLKSKKSFHLNKVNSFNLNYCEIILFKVKEYPNFHSELKNRDKIHWDSLESADFHFSICPPQWYCYIILIPLWKMYKDNILDGFQNTR